MGPRSSHLTRSTCRCSLAAASPRREQLSHRETTEESGFPTVNETLFDAAKTDPGAITNITLNNNEITGVESHIAPLGIVVQHGTDDVEIDNNEIPDRIAADDTDSDPSDGVDFGFAFAQGINTASPATTDTTTNHDVIEGITSAEPILPEPVKIDGDGDGLQSRANQFRVAIGINDRNDTDDGSRDPADDPEIDVKNDYWNSSDRPQEAVFNQDAGDDDRADVVGNIAYQPFIRNPPGKNEEDGGNGSGNDDVGGKGNGNGN